MARNNMAVGTRTGSTSRVSLSQATKVFRAGMLGVLDIASKKVRTHPWMTYLSLAIRHFQLVSFITGTSGAGAPWPSALSPLEVAASLTNLRGYTVWLQEEVVKVAFWLATAWVIVLLLLLSWGMWAFAKDRIPVLWPLKLLRHMGNLSATVLFIPLLQCLLTLQQMYGGDASASSAVTVIVVILSLILAALSFIFASVLYSSDLLSQLPSAKAHGRVDVVMLVVQVVLVVQQRWDMNAWLRVFILAACGLAWLASSVYALPYFHHFMNRFDVAGAVLYMWGVLCLCLNVGYRSTDAAIMLYCGVPLAIGAGIALTDWRANRIMGTPPAHLGSAIEVELKARYIIHSVVYGHPLVRRAGVSGRMGAGLWGSGASASAAYLRSRPNDMANQPWIGAGTRGPAPTAMGLKDGSAAGVGPGLAGTGPGGMLTKTGPGAAAGHALGQPHGHGQMHGPAFGGHAPAQDMDHLLGEEDAGIGDDGEGGRARLPVDVVSEVLQLYRQANARFRQSAMLHVYCARFYGQVLGNRHMQLSHLLQAAKRSPALDLAFVVFQARKAADDQGGENISALNRVAWEKFQSDARRQVQLAAQKQLAYWTELMDTCPDLSRLHRLSSETNMAIQGAEAAFAELQAINPQSLAMIRLYAAFNLHVTCNTEKATVLLAEADRLEDAKSKEHRAEGATRLAIMAETPLDVWAENTGLITVSAANRDVGIIRNVNAAACKLFGYTRLQMERRSVFTLLPPGLSELHEESMRQYVATGEGTPGIVGYSRVSFLLNKSGTIVPVVSAVRDAPADDGPPAFIWAMRELRSSMHYIMLDANGAIIALSPGSQALLGLDPASLASGDATMMDFVVEWAVQAFQEELLTPGGSTLRVDVASSGGRGMTSAWATAAPMAMADTARDTTARASNARDTTAAPPPPMPPRRAQEQECDNGNDDDADSMEQGFGSQAGSESDDDEGDGQGDGSAYMPKPGLVTKLSPRAGWATTPTEALGATTVAVRRASIMGAVHAETSWLRGHLQPLPLGPRGTQQGYVLHWTHISSGDTVAIAKAEAKRAAFLGDIAMSAALAVSPGAAMQMGLPPSAGRQMGMGMGMNVGMSGQGQYGQPSRGQMASQGMGMPQDAMRNTSSSAYGTRKPPTAPGLASSVPGTAGTVGKRKPVSPRPRLVGTAGTTEMPPELNDGEMGQVQSFPSPEGRAPAPLPRTASRPNMSGQPPRHPGSTNRLTQSQVSALPGSTSVDEGTDEALDNMLQLANSSLSEGEAEAEHGSSGRHVQADGRAAQGSEDPGAGGSTQFMPRPPSHGIMKTRSGRVSATGAHPSAGGGEGSRVPSSSDAGHREAGHTDVTRHDPGSNKPQEYVLKSSMRSRPTEGSGTYGPAPGASGRLVPAVRGPASPSAGHRSRHDHDGRRDEEKRSVVDGRSVMDGGKSVYDGARSVAGHKAGSVHSGDGSESSKSSGIAGTVRSMARLRRIVSVENPPLLPGLRWLRLAGVGLSIMAIILSAVVSVVTRNNFLQLLSQTEYVGLGAERMVQKASAIIAAQELMFRGRGWKHISDDAAGQARVAILGNTSLFSDTHRQMFSLVQGTPSAVHWTTRYITYTLFGIAPQPVGGIGGKYSTLNLMEVGEAFAGLMKQMASAVQMPDSAYNLYNDGCGLGEPHLAALNVEFMKGGNAHEALASSMNLGYEATVNGAAQVQTTQLIVFVSMVATICVVGALVFFPILGRIDASMDAVMMQFVRLPYAVRSTLYLQAARRLRTLRRDYAEDDDDMEDEESDGEDAAGDEQGNQGPMFSGPGPAPQDGQPAPGSDGEASKPATGDNGQQPVATEAGSSVDWGALANAEIASLASGTDVKSYKVGNKSKHEGKSKSKRGLFKAKAEEAPAFRKTGSSLFIFRARFIAPLVALLVFFAAIFGAFSVLVDKTLVLTSVSAAADRRSSCARQAMVDLRKLSFLTTDGQYITNTYFYTMNAYSCVRDHVRLLGYGKAGSRVDSEPYARRSQPVENGSPSVLSSDLTEKVYDAMFSNACPLLKEYNVAHGLPFNMTACETFGGGVVTLGLSALVDLVWRTVLDVGDRQLRGQFIQGSLYQGYAWSVPRDTFDYTTLVCELRLGCNPYRTVQAPTDGSVLDQTFLSDPTYIGDHAANLQPGQGTVPAGSVPYRIEWELGHPQMKFLEEADSFYLTPALLAIGDLYREESRQAVQTFLSFLNTFVPTYMVLFVIFMATVFNNMILSTNKDIQAKRSMLLYLPVPIVARAKTIRQLIAEIISADADGGGLAGGVVILPTPGGPGTTNEVAPIPLSARTSRAAGEKGAAADTPAAAPAAATSTSAMTAKQLTTKR